MEGGEGDFGAAKCGVTGGDALGVGEDEITIRSSLVAGGG